MSRNPSMQDGARGQADRRPFRPGSGMSEGALLWTLSLAVVLALHVGLGAYLLAPTPEVADGQPDDAITVDLMPEPSEQAEKPDEVAGPNVAESAAPTNGAKADDPDPPAPDAPPPTKVERKPDMPTPDPVVPPSPSGSDAVLPPSVQQRLERTREDRPPDQTPPDEKDPEARQELVERQTAPSRASAGSAGLLGGGRRPSAAAQATWRGAVGLYLGRHRRYPQEAREHGMQGTAKVRVTIDADGHVMGSELVQSSGRALLDGEALALMLRCDPFPKPPTGMPVPVVMTVPVTFAIRHGA